MIKLKNILKGWEEPNTPRRWSRSYSSTNGLTEFEQLGGKDTVSEQSNRTYHVMGQDVSREDWKE